MEYTADYIASKLKKPKKQGGYWMACCPSHDDNNPSLQITEKEGRVLFHCHAGCSQSQVIEAFDGLGLWVSKKNKTDLNLPQKVLMSPKKTKLGKPVETYQYRDESGDIVFETLRFEPKTFRARTKGEDGKWLWKVPVEKWTIYNLPKVIESNIVCICEGEKDANTLITMGITATTSPFGAKKWQKKYNKFFKEKQVFIIPDQDKQGKEHAELVADQLIEEANRIKIINLPNPESIEKFDVTDWAKLGGNRAKLSEIISKSSFYIKKINHEPSQSARTGIIESWPHVTDKGRPLTTIQNLELLLKSYNIVVKYNVISKDIEIRIPGQTYSMDNSANCSLNHIISLAREHQMSANNIHEFIINVADKYKFNSVAEWITSKPWDGKDRFTELTETVPNTNPELSRILMWRWMLSAVAAIFEEQGVSAQGVLVFQGKQAEGKTSWYWSLMGGNIDWGIESVCLKPNDKDSVAQSIGYWLVELGELESTFKKSDIEALRGFVTKKMDELRRPFDKTSSKYARRTVFFASVNEVEYLRDNTGNRRWWTVGVNGRININHKIDMQQCWAQIYQAYNDGDHWHLSTDEQEMLNRHNENYEPEDPIKELINSNFDLNCPRTKYMTATDVLVAIGYDKPNKQQTRECSTLLRKLLGEDAVPRKNGRYFKMPEPLKFWS